MPPYFTPKTNPEGSNALLFFAVCAPPRLTAQFPSAAPSKKTQACAAHLSAPCSLKTKICALVTARLYTAG